MEGQFRNYWRWLVISNYFNFQIKINIFFQKKKHRLLLPFLLQIPIRDIRSQVTWDNKIHCFLILILWINHFGNMTSIGIIRNKKSLFLSLILCNNFQGYPMVVTHLSKAFSIASARRAIKGPLSRKCLLLRFVMNLKMIKISS